MAQQESNAVVDRSAMRLGGERRSEQDPCHSALTAVSPSNLGQPSVSASAGNQVFSVMPLETRNMFGIARMPFNILPAPSMPATVIAQSVSLPQPPSQTMPQPVVQWFSLVSSTQNFPVQPLTAAPLAISASNQASAVTNANLNGVPLQFNFTSRQHMLEVPFNEPVNEEREVSNGGAVPELMDASEEPAVQDPSGAPSAPTPPVVCTAQPKTALQMAFSNWAGKSSGSTSKMVPGRLRRESGDVAEATEFLCRTCECNFRCTSQKLLEQHMVKSHIIPFSNICNLCGKKAPSFKAQMQHMVQHATVTCEKPAVQDPDGALSASDACTEQPKTALQESSSNWAGKSSGSTSKIVPGRLRLESGDVADVTEVVRYMCDCSFRCTSQKLLKEHMIKSHVIPLSNICNLCGKKSLGPKAQKQHMVLHTTVTSIDEALNSKMPLSQKPSTSCDPPREDSPLVTSTVHIDSDEDAEGDSKPLTGNKDPDIAFMKLRQDLVGTTAIKPFFKCTLVDCKFTSDTRRPFFDHLGAHTVKELGALLCIYCSQKFEAIFALLEHMVSCHGQRRYQCGWCLYRSAFLIHLQIHHHHFHHEKKVLFFKCPNIPAESPSKSFAGQCVTLTHYWCSVPGCSYKHLDPDTFEWHLSNEHPRTLEYQCKICDVTTVCAKDLVRHCVEHDMDVVQCVYCHHSEPSYKEMLWHLATYHQDHPLVLFIRTEKQRSLFKEFIARFQSIKLRGIRPRAMQKQQQPAIMQVEKSGSIVVEVASAEEPNKPSETEMTLQCKQCRTKFTDLSQLRSHLYIHKEYFPHSCEPCSKYFTTVDEAQAHERKRHRTKGILPMQEFRLPPTEMEVDTCIDEEVERLDAQVEALDTAKCPWQGCSRVFTDMECVANHVRADHVPKRHMCALCEFSSYSPEVVRWHTKNTHKPSGPRVAGTSSASKKVTTGERKCGQCSFRAETLCTVREHYRKAHPGLAFKYVVPKRHGRTKADVAKKCVVPPPPSEPRSSTAASPPAKASLSTSWQETQCGLPCDRCEHIAPSEHMLHMHKSLRHSTQPCATKMKRTAKLLKNFGWRVSAAYDREQKTPCQREDENPNAPVRELSTRTSVKVELQSEEDKPEVDEDPEPTPPENERPETKLIAQGDVRCKDDAQCQRLLRCQNEAHEQHPSICENNPQGEQPSCSKGFVCSSKTCTERFATKTELHSHMSRKHKFFAVCSHCKKPCMNRAQVLHHLQSRHPNSKICYTVISHKRQNLERKPTLTSSADLNAGFSWYNKPREPISLKNVSVWARMPSSTSYVKLDVDVFFKVCSANPSVVVKDYLKSLV